MDYLERGTAINDSIEPYEWMLAPAPRLRGIVPTLTVAAVFAIPFSLAAGFVATTRPLDGLYAMPLLVAMAAYFLRENLG